MSRGKLIKCRYRILVKAFPQPSKKHEETVCCAGITEDGSQLHRLYPIRYRRLSSENQFNRFDLVEMDVEKSTSDNRPESYRISEDSIRIIQAGNQLSATDKAKLWKPFVVESLPELEHQREATGRSLGIIKAPIDSLEFYRESVKKQSTDDMAISNSLFEQISLIEDPLRKLERPEYDFRYRFISGGIKYTRKLTDWEPYAAWFKFKRKYGKDAFKHLKKAYQEELPKQNLHFILGTVKSHQHRFIIIGLLRTKEDLDMVDSQGSLDLKI